MAKEIKATQVVVLNTIQAAAADLIFSGGKLKLNDGTNDLSEDVKLTDATQFVATAYAAGTPSVKDYDFAGVALLANSQYRFAVIIPEFANVAGNVSAEADELIPIREYVFWTGSAVPTANDIRDGFIQQIALDPNAKVTPSSGGAGVMTLALNDVNDCDFDVEVPAGTIETVITPYVEPAGTPAIVEALAPTKSSAGAQYKTYELAYEALSKNGLISGGKVFFPETLVVFADTLAANFAAFDTEMLAITGGTHTPVADYLGV